MNQSNNLLTFDLDMRFHTISRVQFLESIERESLSEDQLSQTSLALGLNVQFW